MSSDFREILEDRGIPARKSCEALPNGERSKLLKNISCSFYREGVGTGICKNELRALGTIAVFQIY